MSENEKNIIARAKFLSYSTQLSRKKCFRQAIHEFLKPKELQNIYLLFDITENDYINYLESKKW